MLAALFPRPHENLLVYFGVLAANARRRAAVVDCGRKSTTRPLGLRCRSRSPRDWATLMKRGLGVDVMTCPECGARFRIRALLDDPRVARPFAAKLGRIDVDARAGPTVGASSRPADTHDELDPDFVERDHVA